MTQPSYIFDFVSFLIYLFHHTRSFKQPVTLAAFCAWGFNYKLVSTLIPRDTGFAPAGNQTNALNIVQSSTPINRMITDISVQTTVKSSQLLINEIQL